MDTELPSEPPTLDSSLDLDMLATLEQQERPKPRERVASGSTYLLLALLGLVGSFAAGAWYQREHGDKPNVTATAGSGVATAIGGARATGAANEGPARSRGGATQSSAPDGSAPGGLNAAGGLAGAGTVGQVKLIDGNNVYLTDAQGNTVKVITQPGLAVNVTKSGTIAELKAGDTIIVTGETNADGFIKASAIRSGNQAGAGGVAGAQGGRGGAGAAATTTR